MRKSNNMCNILKTFGAVINLLEEVCMDTRVIGVLRGGGGKGALPPPLKLVKV